MLDPLIWERKLRPTTASMMGLSPCSLSLRRQARLASHHHRDVLSPEHVAESLREQSVCLLERSPDFADDIDLLLLVFFVVVGVRYLGLFLNTLRYQPEVEHPNKYQTK